MEDQHVTKVEFDYYAYPQSWKWTCSCGKSDSGYPHRQRAVNAGDLHRIMESLKESK